LGRPFTAPPGIPVERLAILRKAFAEMFVDPEFVADCARQGLEADAPATGEQLQKIVTDAYAAPPAIIERLMNIYGSRM
jgi:tripartite-type tricarboxylate transporter receptor subunit TctC